MIGNFIEKCIVNDYNKNFLDYYDEKSDYFIIDFATMVRDGLVKQTLEDGTIHYFTNSSKHRARNKVGRNVIEVLPGKKEYISSKEILQQENIALIVDRFCAWLEEKGYKPKQLILVEVKHARYYSDEKRLIEFENWEQLEWENRTLDEINRLFLTRYPECHFIRFPDGYYGGLRHRWGLFSLHYCDEVYDYLYDMVNMITERGEITEEAERQVRSKYANRIQNNVKQLNQFSSTVDKLELNYQQERRKAFTYSILLKQQVSGMLEQVEKVAELHSKPILYGMIHAARVGWTARQWEH